MIAKSEIPKIQEEIEAEHVARACADIDTHIREAVREGWKGSVTFDMFFHGETIARRAVELYAANGWTYTFSVNVSTTDLGRGASVSSGKILVTLS